MINLDANARWFLLNTSPGVDRELFFGKKSSPDFQICLFELMNGISVANKIGNGIRLEISSESKCKNRLKDLVDSNLSVPIVHSDVIGIMKRFDLKAEAIPIHLTSASGKTLSDEYFIWNPLILSDPLDWERSKMDRDSETGKVFYFEEIVLKRSQLPGLPHAFRIGSHPSSILISEAIVEALQESSASNFYVTELKVTDA